MVGAMRMIMVILEDQVVEQELEIIQLLVYLQLLVEQEILLLLVLRKEIMVVRVLKLHLVVITLAVVVAVLQVQGLMDVLLDQVVMVEQAVQVQ